VGEQGTYQLILQLKDELTTALKQIQTQLGKTKAAGTSMKKETSNLEKSFGQVASRIAQMLGPMATLRTAYRLIKSGIEDSVRAALEEEQSLTKLTASIISVGQEHSISADRIRAFGEGLMKTTTFTHEATEAAAGYLISIAGLTEQGVMKAIPALQDYASAMGIDLATAAEQMSFAMEGGRNVFKKYGVELNDTMTQSEKFDAIMAGITGKFKGMASEMAKTTSGQLTQLKNILWEISANGGKLMLEFASPFIKWLTKATSKMDEYLSKMLEMHDILKKIDQGKPLTGEEAIKATEREIEIFRSLLKQRQKELDAELQFAAIADATPEIVADINKRYGAAIEQIQKTIDVKLKSIKTIKKMIDEAAEKNEPAGNVIDEDVVPGWVKQAWADLADLKKAYTSTDDGQKKALEDEMKRWREYTATTQEQVDMVIAVLEELQAAYDKLVPPRAPDITYRGTSAPRGQVNAERADEKLANDIDASYAEAELRLMQFEDAWERKQMQNLKREMGESRAHLTAEEQLTREALKKQQEDAAKSGAIAKLNETLNAFMDPTGAFANLLTKALEDAVSAQAVAALNGENVDMIATFFSSLETGLKTLMSSMAELAPLILLFIALKEIFEAMWAIIGPTIDAIWKPVSELLQTIGNMLGTLLLPILEPLEPIIRAICQLLTGLLVPAFALLLPVMKVVGLFVWIMAAAIIGMIDAIIAFINILIPGTRWDIPIVPIPPPPKFHSGGRADDDMLAVLKKGEIVTNPYKHSSYVAGGGGGGVTIIAPNARYIDKSIAAELVKIGLAGMRA
jgi:hypothetical protein